MESAKREWANAWCSSPKPLFYDGRFQEATSGRLWTSINPTDQSELCQFAMASQEDVNQAVISAQKAFQSGVWSRMPIRQRAATMRNIGEVVRQHRAELATLETLANGKLYREAYEDDLPDSADIFDYYAGWIDKFYGETCPVEDGFLNYTLKEPLGVCALISPWNFPLLLAMWKVAPALATGNTIVIKPSEFTSLSLIRFFELIATYVDLPPGVLNLVLGDGQTGGYLTEHPHVNKVSFTGSTQTGRRILQASAASNLKSVTLELGGKSPNIIFDDVPDLNAAIERSFTAMYSHKGEKCSEPTRLFVHDDHYDEVVSRIATLADAVICGDPFGPESQQGPQCHRAHFEKVMHYIAEGQREGARLVAGGTRDTSGENAKGWFVRPTLFADVDNQMSIAQDEIFGPVLVATRFRTEEEVVAMANQTIYGLAAGLWTRDVSRAHRVAHQLDAGMVFINRYGCYDFCSPFGGFKQSGWGKEMAIHSLDAYTKTKSIWLKL